MIRRTTKEPSCNTSTVGTVPDAVQLLLERKDIVNTQADFSKFTRTSRHSSDIYQLSDTLQDSEVLSEDSPSISSQLRQDG